MTRRTRETVPDVTGRKVLVVGAARTGREAALFLAERGAVVTVTDVKPQEALGALVGELEAAGVMVDVGGHRDAVFTAADLIVVSPGVPLSIPLLAAARTRGQEVISEIELAARFLTIPLVAITGTNGKSTTTSLTGHLFLKAGVHTFVGGNLGTPLVAALRGRKRYKWAVVEVSSFQLEGIVRFTPTLAALLNISPDHQDRYPVFDAYVEAKRRLVMNQRPEHTAVLNGEDALVKATADGLAARVVWFSSAREVLGGVFTRGGTVISQVTGRETTYDLSKVRLAGLHNRENILASVALAEQAGLPPEAIALGLRTFRGLPHRLEYVAAVDGVDYYDDSKATNIGAVERSLASFDRPVVLILGGRDKGADFVALSGVIREHVKSLIVYGEARTKIYRVLGDLVDSTMVPDLRDAVRLARKRAARGDVVLLAPACTSFDQFANFEARGDAFQEAVRAFAPPTPQAEGRRGRS